MSWKLDRSNAVAMSCPSRTQEEFIRPMNFSISSSDLCGNESDKHTCDCVSELLSDAIKTGRGPTPTCK